MLCGVSGAAGSHDAPQLLSMTAAHCESGPRARAHAQALSMILFDYDTLDPDDEIGRVSLPIKDFEEKQHHDMWVEVYDPAAQKDTQTAAKVGGPVASCHVLQLRLQPLAPEQLGASPCYPAAAAAGLPCQLPAGCPAYVRGPQARLRCTRPLPSHVRQRVELHGQQGMPDAARARRARASSTASPARCTT